MRSGPYRVGPWPGLTPRGALVLLAHAVLLGVGLALIGSAGLPVVGVITLLPMAIATRIVSTPGAASAVCGAYLMPRTLASLVNPDVQLPPLLLVPSLAFDLALWLRRTDLTWRKRRRRQQPRSVTCWRAVIAGAVYGAVLAAVEPAYQQFVGASSDETAASVALTIIFASLVALVSVRGKAG
jgi:hypothetical protein